MFGLRTPALLGAAGLATGLVAVGSLISSRGRRGQPFDEFRQAPFAPPGWAFGPAWTINKVASSWSEARVVDADPDTVAGHEGARRVAIAAGVVSESLYLTFPVVYFRYRSPVLAAAVTCGSAAATVVQAEATRRFDRSAAAALAPQLAWLALAVPVAVYQAAYNRDPALHTSAVLD